MKHPVVMPHLGATGGDVRIVEWRVGKSALVAAGIVLLVVETDKSVVDVEAFRAGRLVGPLAAEGSFVAPGETIGYVSDEPAGAAATITGTISAPEGVRMANPPAPPKTAAAPAEFAHRPARVALNFTRRERQPRGGTRRAAGRGFRHNGADPPLRGAPLSAAGARDAVPAFREEFGWYWLNPVSLRYGL